MTTDIPTLKNKVTTTDIPTLKNISNDHRHTKTEEHNDHRHTCASYQVTASTSDSTVWISQSSFVKKSNLKNRQINNIIK